MLIVFLLHLSPANPLLCPLEADGESSSLGWVAFWCKSHDRTKRSALRVCGQISGVFRMADDNTLFFFPFFSFDGPIFPGRSSLLVYTPEA